MYIQISQLQKSSILAKKRNQHQKLQKTFKWNNIFIFKIELITISTNMS